ncbi:MAG TPA: DegQ family serine endoprotease [Rhizomicrobium sp.]|nr:DegQ family serine endoprotease [Rhizomicrobium sp.]
MTQVAAADVPAKPRVQPPRMLENGAPFSFADLVERVSPAVVSVTVESKATPTPAMGEIPDNIPEPFRQFFRNFGGPNAAPQKSIGVGSGFIVDKSGYIVTNNHVVSESSKISVKLPDGRQFEAKLIGADTATDVALLKVKSDKPLPTVEFGDDRRLRVGDWVVAVGNPFGLSNSVTAGIVSSIGRDVGNGPYTDFIQIDAPINRGNSGGPTFDLRGEVVGMNSMIYSPTGGSVGIGFAIPASTIHDVISQLKAHGHVNRGWLGVQIQSLTPEIAASLGTKDMEGAIIAEVVPDGPAAKAGLQQGDVVVAVNGKPVQDSRDLSRRVAALLAGSKATFTVMRDGARKDVTAHITLRKDQQVASNQPGGGNAQTPSKTQALGLGLSLLTPDMRRQLNLGETVNGVVITTVDPKSDAASKGLRAGDVVRSIGNRAVQSPQDVQGRIADAKAAGRKSVLLLVTRGGGERFIAVDIGET